jgi:hypothetical protein
MHIRGEQEAISGTGSTHRIAGWILPVVVSAGPHPSADLGTSWKEDAISQAAVQRTVHSKCPRIQFSAVFGSIWATRWNVPKVPCLMKFLIIQTWTLEPLIPDPASTKAEARFGIIVLMEL